MPYKAARVHRAKDYPPELHNAIDRLERAQDVLLNENRHPEHEIALKEVHRLQGVVGWHMRRLDMKRRPEAYGKV